MNLQEQLEEQLYTSIPLRATDFGHLEVTARINDIDVLFLIDTGAASTVIDIAFASDNNLEVEETTIKGGGVGTSDLVIYQLCPVQVSLHAFALSDLAIYAADLQHVKQSLLEKGETQLPCGVIGADVLFHHKAIIDYNSLRLYLQ